MTEVADLSVRVTADTSAAEKGLDGLSSKVSGFGANLAGLAGGAAVAGIGALAAGFAVGLSGASELEGATAKLQGQLGLTGEQAAELGEVVTNVFRNNFGESQAAVGEAVAAISQNIKGLTPAAVQTATESALALEGLFEAPVAESARAVGVMMRNFEGLSESQAFDLLAVGFQKGGNFADDLLDTLTEYAPQFAKMGLSAEQAMGTLIAGADAGAFNMDKVGDAVKEFSIRAIDGSKTTAEGFATIGLNADQMAAAIAKGGPSAEQAYGTTLAALSTIEDPLKRNTAGVALFGTQWEDIGPTVVAAMSAGTKGVEGYEGAAKRAADTTGLGFATAVEGLKRSLTGLLQDAVTPLLPGMTSVINAIAKSLPDAMGVAKDALRPFSDAFKQAMGGDIVGAVGTLKDGLGKIGTEISTGVGEWARSFAAWVDSASPDLISNLGDMLISLQTWVRDSGFKIIETLATWAAAFIDWVAPKIPDLLRELGALLVKLTVWAATDGLPTLVSKLAEWGLAFVEWVAPRIPPLLLELGKLLLELGTWIVTTALPAIVGKLAEWGGAFLGWVAKDVLPTLPEKLGAILTAVGAWIGEKVTAFGDEAKRIGSGLVQGIQDGVSGALGGFWTWLQTNFVDKIPSFVRELLNINSPSGVFMDIGRNIVDGLRVGMQSRLPSIEDVVSRLVGTVATTGEVTDWLKAAMSVAGVGGDWLSGLSRLAQWESTGNPRAVNPTSVAGQHATGLMQTLPSTFRSFALPGMGEILNPIHNAAAAIRYIMATYGHVNNIPGIASGNHEEFPGYARGGIAWGPQLAMVGEREPEAIIPRSWFGRGGSGGAIETHRFVIQDPSGRTLEEWYVTGRELAMRRGRS